MADETSCNSTVFPEDVIHRQGEPHTLGLVLQTADDSSAESDSEDEDFIKKGQVLVCWYPSGKEETLALEKLKLADRSLLPGDVVRFADIENGNQKGYVKDVSVIADVRVIGTSQVITNIDCKYLEPLQQFAEGTHVTYGSWLGTVKKAYQRVTLRLKNASRCTLEGDQVNMLYDLSDQRDEDSPFFSEVFYPSQPVGGPARAFKEATWLSGAKPILNSQVQIKAVIEQANVIAVEVNWRVCGACCPGSNEADSLKPPDTMITEEQIYMLKALQHFHYSSVQIGDKGFYVVKNSNCNEDNSQIHEHAEHSSDAGEIENKSETQTVSVETNSPTVHVENVSVSVKSQNGAEQGAVDSWKTYWSDVGVKLGDGHQYGPDDEQCSSFKESEETKPDEKVALLQNEESTESVISSNVDKSSSEARLAKCLSADHLHAIGTTSDELLQGSDSDDSDLGESHKHGKRHADNPPKPQSKRRRKRLRRKRKHVPYLKINPGDRICVEVVKTVTSVDVIWQDNNCQCGIHSTDLVPVIHLDELESFPGDIVVDKRPDSKHVHGTYGVIEKSDHIARTCNVRWFTLQGELINLESDVSVYDLDDHPDWSFSPGDVVVSINTDEYQQDGVLKYRPPAGQVIHVTGNGTFLVRWVDGTTSEAQLQIVYKVNEEDDDGDSWETESDRSGNAGDEEWETASGESADEEVSNGLADLIISDAPLNTMSSPTEDAPDENIDAEILQSANNLINTAYNNTAQEFLMLESVHDGHKFKSFSFQPQNPRKFAAVVRKEIMLLQASLPTGILVRGFEDRMDLGCALIHGSDGTPYEDGLFCFDMLLPPDYPASPPQFHYLSFCHGRLNPNLYDDGNVCVSLLGTWTGKGSETWTSKSNLLQVLLSVQGLILCSEPYYNEAGFEKQRQTMQGHENSRLYNEMVLLKLIQSMLNIAKNPPQAFKQEVEQHLKQTSHRFINRIQTWIDSSVLSAEHCSNCPAENNTLQETSEESPQLQDNHQPNNNSSSVSIHNRDSPSQNDPQLVDEDSLTNGGVKTVSSHEDECNIGNTSDVIPHDSLCDHNTTTPQNDPSVIQSGSVDDAKDSSDDPEIQLSDSPGDHSEIVVQGHSSLGNIQTSEDTTNLTVESNLHVCNKSTKCASSVDSIPAISHQAPPYPLLPLSKGICMSLQRNLTALRDHLLASGLLSTKYD